MKLNWRYRLNPFQALSPLLIRTTSIDTLHAEFGPIIYSPGEAINCHELLEMPVPPHMQHLQKDIHESPIGSVRVLDDIIYSAAYPDKNMLLTKNRLFIEDSSSTMRAAKHFDWRCIYRPVQQNIEELCFIYRGVSNNYYHTLIDNLPRLMSLHHPDIQKLGQITLLVPDKLTPVEAYLFDKLLPPNTRVQIIESGKSYGLKHCLFPTFITQQFSGYVTSSFRKWLAAHLLPKRPRKNNKRIYISRSLANQRRLINEDEIAACARKHDFEIHHLENMSFENQIELFYDAQCVVGLHGAGFANLLFSENTRVLELFSYRYTKPSYYFLTRAIDGRYQYVLGSGEEINIDISLPVQTVESEISKMLGSI